MLTALLFATLAATEGPGVNQFLSAARAPSEIILDGKVDEAAWHTAPVFDGFLQTFPDANKPPSERTELRVLFDDAYLYVSFVCFDSRPETLLASLSRRDDIPGSDLVGIAIDTRHDHRSAFVFRVNAGGVLLDGVMTQDTQFTNTWDAVWDARVARRPDGWSAEMKIPLNALPGSTSDLPTWGFFARRDIARTHETITSVVIPRNANAIVSRYGHLRGVAQKPGISVQWVPYAAARLVLTPEVEGQSEPRVMRPSADVGFDLTAQLTRETQLNATFNPDFGQLEADRIAQNLSNTELFFPERRPFFTQGLDVFLPVGAQNGRSPHTLFYPRRIGLDTPIFLAGKFTGTVGSTQVGLLDAVVSGPWVPLQPGGKKSREFGFHLERPLHFGLNDELPDQPVTTTNYLAAVVRLQASKNATYGAMVTSVVPVATGCPAGRACDPSGGNAGALDWNFKSDSGDWNLLGQLEGSVVTGPAERTLRDGVLLRAYDMGWGFYARGGKVGGEPFRFRVDVEYASPTLELNQIGYLQNQNFMRGQVYASWVKTGREGLFSELYLTLGTNHYASTDGRDVYRGGGVWLNLESMLSTFDFVGCNADIELPRYDIREVGSTGIPFGRGPAFYFDCYAETDATRTVQVVGDLSYGYNFPYGLFAGNPGYGGEVTGRFRFHPRVLTELVVGLDYTPHGPRYIESISAEQFRFGELHSRFLSLTLRQQFVLTPRLTLQAWGQLFTDSQYALRFFNGSSTGQQPINGADLDPVLGPPKIERSSALNFNVVL